MKIDALVLSCEHGGNEVPAAYRHLFKSRRAQAALLSHRGHDLGTLRLTKTLEKEFGVKATCQQVTRLLVENNRSIDHAKAFSEFSNSLGATERDDVVRKYYHPHRHQVQAAIARQTKAGKTTLHVSVHSFAATLRGQKRNADIGLLYDPARETERRFCGLWKSALIDAAPDLRVRRNYPYRGIDDGLTTHLRTVFGVKQYLGIELEVNQAWVGAGDQFEPKITDAIVLSLRGLLD